ncbi:PQQ-dependent sugar dehydrogenase [Pedobacter xixiisoli]|uniref:Glucose/arabinose dehydrogenase, beta-propeller fold n=1 Tax=Pedobacter xixiisoli TaxID=1476464 RepID=A0A285ZTN8_9SPHI|nr:PQQ-dependent sugar dehydrogenase [Pedobacter xixiisoli]SOD13010.1 Glucose/arabinose dehydrogenase, beta-propeller fold [Pedobacter xixiisoli]
MKKLLLAAGILLFIMACKKDRNDEDLTPVDLKTKVLVSNLNLPWEIIYGPDNLIWFTEKAGKISRINPSNNQVIALHTISDVRVQGEGGLLGMALHPNFNTSPFVYVFYGYGNPYKNKLVRFNYANNALSNPQTLLDNIPASSNHNGSRLLISGDKLFVTTGDAEDLNTPQNVNSLAGKVLRLNLDGSIPADNPFPNNPVWSYGHRNAQGLAMVGNKLFSSEHGPSTDDEVNIIEKGRNYGWPTVTGKCNASGETAFCNQNNVAESIIEWTPTIAPSGMTYYNSNYIPQFKNSLLLAFLKGNKLMQLKLNDAQTAIVETEDFYVGEFRRIRAVTQSPEGKIYICTSNGGNADQIVEISK